MFDAVIIGKGPAGLTAGIYLCRAGRKAVIIGKDNKIWNKDVRINNVFGLGEVTGMDLMVKGEAQAKSFGAEIVNDLIVKVEMKSDNFRAVTAKGEEFIGKKLLIATGAPAKKKIANENDFIGKGVSYCVSCDGFFFKDKKVFVAGNSEFALREAVELLDYTKDVTIISNGKKLLFDKELLDNKGIKFDDSKIIKITGKEVVAGIKTNKGVVKIDGLFVALGDASSWDLANMLGVIVKNNEILADNNMRTNVNNVWAAGDCTPGLKQVITAMAKGGIAAADMIRGGEWS
ncbi:NAD(P)/FAD-dependent oxidoreductase [archaeon CG06_land_8_20_14_3_00_37_11]|nr:MAG: NAD(P)/FAD-dependent oxidoreductase [archaeon CG06_land_8_20_14_3_00_37_11]